MSTGQSPKVKWLVAGMVSLAIGVAVLEYSAAQPSPGIWELTSFVLIAFLLNQSTTRLRVSARGSTSFVIHMAAGILFGAFWAGLVAALATIVWQSSIGAPRINIAFNTAQRAFSVIAAVAVYRSLGGSVPPAFLQVGGPVESASVQQDLLLFFVFAGVYFIVNSVAVSSAAALSSGRSFRDVWTLNTRGVLGYDIGASAIALLAAWLYVKSQALVGLGSVGLFLVVIPVAVVRHIYGLYYQLQDSGQELLQVMVKAIEARDPYTSGHSLRVSAMSRTIALELGLPVKEVEQIETAALLHDVGKIHEEFAPLLRKESRLTPEETALMQTHSTKSAELVGIISKFRGFIQESVRHHHERWDGQGYPTGLAGEAIPLGSRIILVSDTIDAMTTDRPYRKRLSLEVVVAELQKCKGTQFDPEVVDVVVSSVAVRRLISGVASVQAGTDEPLRSRRVSWPGASLWRVNRR